MIGINEIIAIIPARKGSKRLKNKNIFLLNKIPLIEYTIMAAKKSNFIDKIIVSTDSKKILSIANKNGIKVNKLRPKKLSEDNTPTIDVIKYETKKLKKKNYFILVLQPTSPLRSTLEIDRSIEIFYKKNLSSLVSISKYKSKPKFEILKNRKKTITNFNPVKKNKYFYGLNGSIFLSTLYFINKYNRLYRKGSYCYETKYKSSIDIDTIDDIKLIKKYI